MHIQPPDRYISDKNVGQDRSQAGQSITLPDVETDAREYLPDNKDQCRPTLRPRNANGPDRAFNRDQQPPAGSGRTFSDLTLSTFPPPAGPLVQPHQATAVAQMVDDDQSRGTATSSYLPDNKDQCREVLRSQNSAEATPLVDAILLDPVVFDKT